MNEAPTLNAATKRRAAPREVTPLAALVGLTALAALLRFATLDAKSFWEDEAETALLVRMDFWEMLDELGDIGATPPLYFSLARVWTALFGTGEVGIRSLSALVGTAAVPVAYLVARELVSRRAGLVTAALVAVNPLLIWYAQEARSYALLVLLTGLALLFFARALRDPRPRELALWAFTSGLALATHYFAVFLLVPEAAWLLAVHRARRAVLVGAAATVAVGALLLPFALEQEVGSTWIKETGSLATRVVQIPGIFMVGFEASAPLVVAAVAAALVAVGLYLLAMRATSTERRGAVLAGGIGVVAIALPLAMSLIERLDYLNYKNVIGALLPLTILVAAGFGAERAGRLGPAAAAALSALSLAVVSATAWEPKYRREDWRAAAHALGHPAGNRAVVATPGPPAREPLMYYLPRARDMPASGAEVTEIDVLALSRRKIGAIATPRVPRPRLPPPPPAPGYRLVERRDGEHHTLFKYRSTRPVLVVPDQLESSRVDTVSPEVLFQPSHTG